MHSRTPFSRTAPVIVMLIALAAALACNLEVRGGTTPSASPVPQGQRPTVEIFEPAEGATFQQGQVVSSRRGPLAVWRDAGRTAGHGVRVASQPPAEAINPTRLMSSWTTSRAAGPGHPDRACLQ